MARSTSKSHSNKLLVFLVLALILVVSAYVLKKTLTQNICANSLSCELSLKLNVDNNTPGVFNGQEVSPPQIDLSKKDTPTTVLGETTVTGEKHIYVDLTTQTLSAYQADTLFMQVPVSTGKWFPTPTGDFTIWEKVRATKMSGGSGADYYYLPNVPFVMFFSNDKVAAGRGFSLHGAYWHDNFGHAMSHGCVNMRTVDAHKLYDWASPTASGNITLSTDNDPGTKITIYGETR
ncbi:MAG TPA: L,D-transpeptidase [Patescibacteria group bacterium]|nr:L,D-transpeptidase [Patescibacteria group bacterium]